MSSYRYGTKNGHANKVFTFDCDKSYNRFGRTIDEKIERQFCYNKPFNRARGIKYDRFDFPVIGLDSLSNDDTFLSASGDGG